MPPTYTYPQHVKFRDWDCIVKRSFYQHGGVPALILEAATMCGSKSHPVYPGESIAVATVNLPELIELNHCWIKGWGENRGLPEILEKAGIIGPPIREVETGYCKTTVHKLLPPPTQESHAQSPS